MVLSILIHKALGPGPRVSVYHRILAWELRKARFWLEIEISAPVDWKGHEIDKSFLADIIVNRLVLVGLKSVEVLAKVHVKQTLTYLRLTDSKGGLVINFGEALLKNGINRTADGLEQQSVATAVKNYSRQHPLLTKFG